MEENAKVRVITTGRSAKERFDYTKYGIGNLKVPKPEKGLLLRESSIYRALSRSEYFKFIESQKKVKHQEYLFQILGCVGMLCFEADGLRAYTNDFVTGERWSGVWIAIMFGLIFTYFNNYKNSKKISEDLLGKDNCAYQKFLSDLEDHCVDYEDSEES